MDTGSFLFPKNKQRGGEKMANMTMRSEKKYGNGFVKTTYRGVNPLDDDPVYTFNKNIYKYKMHKRHEFKTEKEKAQDRNKKVKNNIAQRANSVNLYYFGTFSSTDLELAKDPERFLALVGDYLKKQGHIFIAVIEPYRDIINTKTGKIYDYLIPKKYRGAYFTKEELKKKAIAYIIEHDRRLSFWIKINKDQLSYDEFKDYYDDLTHRIEEVNKEFIKDFIKKYQKTRNCFHIHVLTNKPIDFAEWIEKYKADPACLYCEKLYENEKNIEKYGIEEARKMQQGYAVEYMEKHVYLTKQLVAKGVHIYRSNIPLIESENRIYLEDNETGKEKLINENEKAKKIRLKKEQEERERETNKKAYRYRLLHGIDDLTASLNVYKVNAYKGGYLPYGFIPFNGIVYSVFGDFREKDVLIHGLCPLDVHQPKIAIKRGAPNLPGVRCSYPTATATPLCFGKKTRFMFIESRRKSHTESKSDSMPLLYAIYYKNKRKKSDTRLYASLIPFIKRLFVLMLSKIMRYIVYVAHIPDG